MGFSPSSVRVGSVAGAPPARSPRSPDEQDRIDGRGVRDLVQVQDDVDDLDGARHAHAPHHGARSVDAGGGAQPRLLDPRSTPSLAASSSYASRHRGQDGRLDLHFVGAAPCCRPRRTRRTPGRARRARATGRSDGGGGRSRPWWDPPRGYRARSAGPTPYVHRADQEFPGASARTTPGPARAPPGAGRDAR